MKNRWKYFFIVLVLLQTSIVVHADVSSGDATLNYVMPVTVSDNEAIIEESISDSDISTPSPTATASPVPTFTPSPTATVSPTPTSTPSPTATVSPVPTSTPTPAATVSPTPIPTVLPTETPVPTEIIRVSLPTVFDVLMCVEPNTGKGYIWSQDIVMINESDFPVEVNISSVLYQIVGEDPAKTAQLSVKLKQFGQPDQWFDIQEGDNALDLRIPLESKKADTDVVSLQKTTFNSMEAIASGDYATINIEGTLSVADWRADDLEVSMVYDLSRVDKTIE